MAALSYPSQTWQWARGEVSIPPTNGNEKKWFRCVNPNGNVTLSLGKFVKIINIDGNLKPGYSQYPTSDIAIAGFFLVMVLTAGVKTGGFNDIIRTCRYGRGWQCAFTVGKITIGINDFGTTTTAYPSTF
jgi:hypothetical protein